MVLRLKLINWLQLCFYENILNTLRTKKILVITILKPCCSVLAYPSTFHSRTLYGIESVVQLKYTELIYFTYSSNIHTSGITN